LKKLVLLLTLAVLVPFALSACGGDGDDAESAPPPRSDASRGAVAKTATRARQTKPGARASLDRRRQVARAKARRTREPSIRILKPTGRQTVQGSAATVSVSVKGFEVVDQRVRPPFPPPVEGKGHVHFYLDTQTLPTTHSPPTTGAYRSISGTTYTWTGVRPGRHSFAVQLVGKDHAPLSRPVKDRITVAVE
jgi:hypothetical protein